MKHLRAAAVNFWDLAPRRILVMRRSAATTAPLQWAPGIRRSKGDLKKGATV